MMSSRLICGLALASLLGWERCTSQTSHQSARSFKQALTEDVVEDGSAVRIRQPTVVDNQLMSEVLWEVEVEDEVLAKLEGAFVGYLAVDMEAITIQNQFRMDGFQNMKICVLGYRKILLWSDKVGEVKELMESVGWWCSLFEKVVPWSPTLASNQRVTWIRCFGVPLHAWGVDLFRALTFKFGRFIEIDGQTKKMERCDVARIKILTEERKTIDSFMAVLVKGQRFEIRVVEDLGGWGDGVWCSKCCGGEDVISSRSSFDGGASVAAMAEGLSESGSDADVSDSCQVLLAIEKRAHGRLEDDDSLGEGKQKSADVSENSPIVLGNSVKLVEEGVNVDNDFSSPRLVESAGTESAKVLGRDIVGPTPGPLLDSSREVIAPGGKGDVVVCREIGPLVTDGGLGKNKKKDLVYHCANEGCELEGRGLMSEKSTSGPTVLRTRSGDLVLNGPNILSPLSATGVMAEVSQVQVTESIEAIEDSQTSDSGVGSKVGKDKNETDFQFRAKHPARKKIPCLPPNMLRKLPRSVQGGKRGMCKRSSSRDRVRSRRGEITAESDPIQSSEEGERKTTLLEVEQPDCELEVVMPFQQGVVLRPSHPVLGGDSGLGYLLEGGGFVMEESQNEELQTSQDDGQPAVTREVEEAKRLMKIGSDLGLKFHDGNGKDTDKMELRLKR
ncbi:hypothetical protein TSUD_163090 [Trifolium subterraneum]|uniref:Uncharacterized protein n=1 Tax=Trifolium subterraneum TaxID=3900 RepID=A0A2Z6NTK4_TRISU|nr:hypothetical protein TSUD_163090 [Trifolium subterraneum]